MFLNFAEDYELETIEKEHEVYSTTHKYAGTLDWSGNLTHKKERKRARIDWKTSNAFYKEYDMQLAAYEMAERELGKEPADVLLVVRFGTQTKRGYSVHEVKDLDKQFEGFLLCQKMWKYVNPNAKPYNKEIPVTLSINKAK